MNQLERLLDKADQQVALLIEAMMVQNQSDKREVSNLFKELKYDLAEIKAQTTKHNGRLTRVERILLILGAVSGTILVENWQDLIGLITAFI